MRGVWKVKLVIIVFVILLGWSMGRPQGLGAQESCTITQLTDSPDESSLNPSINADGTRIAFRSRADLTGQNPEGNIELFLFDTTANAFTQLTDIEPREVSGSFDPVINADGTHIAFWSFADLAGQNEENNFKLFLVDIATNTFTQIPDFDPLNVGDSFPRHINVEGVTAINADGTRIAFLSDSNLTSTESERRIELFLFEATTANLTQLANAGFLDTSGRRKIAVNADGTRIVFDSTADLTQNTEVFLFDTTTNTLTQLPKSDGFRRNHQSPAINADGTCIAFLSFSPDDEGDVVSLFDTTTNTLTQVTDPEAECCRFDSFPAINADGTRIVFRTRADLTGQNPDGGDEVFLGTCPPAFPQSTLENPQPNSFQSGIGVLSGWVCSASVVEIEFDGGARFEAAYGTSRGDTIGVCGDANNGFSLLFNWNLLGDGVHTVQAFADGVEFANVTITVTTLGLGEFPTGLSGSYDLTNFPDAGDITSITWQQSQQNFVIVDVQ